MRVILFNNEELKERCYRNISEDFSKVLGGGSEENKIEKVKNNGKPESNVEKLLREREEDPAKIEPSLCETQDNSEIENVRKEMEGAVEKDTKTAFESEFGIRSVDLENIKGIKGLSVGQRALVLENLRQWVLGKTETMAKDEFAADLEYGGKSRVGSIFHKIRKGMFKKYKIMGLEKANVQNIKGDKFKKDTQKAIEVLATGLEKSKNGVEVQEDGKLRVDYLGANDGIETVAAENFNAAAYAFTKVPAAWADENTCSKKEHEMFKEAEEQYRDARGVVMERIKKSAEGEGDNSNAGVGVALKVMNELNFQVKADQQLTNNPDVEEALLNIKESSVVGRAVSKTFAGEAGLIMGAGYMSKYIARAALAGASVAGMSAALVALPFLSMGFMAWRSRLSGKEKLKDAQLESGKQSLAEIRESKEKRRFDKDNLDILKTLRTLDSLKASKGKWDNNDKEALVEAREILLALNVKQALKGVEEDKQEAKEAEVRREFGEVFKFTTKNEVVEGKNKEIVTGVNNVEGWSDQREVLLEEVRSREGVIRKSNGEESVEEKKVREANNRKVGKNNQNLEGIKEVIEKSEEDPEVLSAKIAELEATLAKSAGRKENTKGFANVEVLAQKLNRDIARLNSLTNDTEKAKVIESLKVRYNFTTDLVERNLVNYGDADESLSGGRSGIEGVFNLNEQMAEAISLLSVQEEGLKLGDDGKIKNEKSSDVSEKKKKVAKEVEERIKAIELQRKRIAGLGLDHGEADAEELKRLEKQVAQSIKLQSEGTDLQSRVNQVFGEDGSRFKSLSESRKQFLRGEMMKGVAIGGAFYLGGQVISEVWGDDIKVGAGKGWNWLGDHIWRIEDVEAAELTVETEVSAEAAVSTTEKIPTIAKIKSGGSIWGAAEELLGDEASDADIAKALAGSTVKIDGKTVPLLNVNIVQVGDTLSYNANSNTFTLTGTGFGTDADLTEAVEEHHTAQWKEQVNNSGGAANITSLIGIVGSRDVNGVKIPAISATNVEAAGIDIHDGISEVERVKLEFWAAHTSTMSSPAIAKAYFDIFDSANGGLELEQIDKYYSVVKGFGGAEHQLEAELIRLFVESGTGTVNGSEFIPTIFSDVPNIEGMEVTRLDDNLRLDLDIKGNFLDINVYINKDGIMWVDGYGSENWNKGAPVKIDRSSIEGMRQYIKDNIKDAETAHTRRTSFWRAY